MSHHQVHIIISEQFQLDLGLFQHCIPGEVRCGEVVSRIQLFLSLVFFKFKLQIFLIFLFFSVVFVVSIFQI